MHSSTKNFLCLAFLLVAIWGCGRESAPPAGPAAGAPASTDESAVLADALAATYRSHAAASRVVDWAGNVLQDGDNGYTCMPTPPDFAARGAASPMCLDDVWMEWADAWQKRKPFSTDKIGIAYMLAGDGGASNVDPYATGPTEDNEWIVEGPHLMIIAPSHDLLAGIPTDPSSGGPYIMWHGTDYEHVMVPVKIPDATAAETPLEDALSAADAALQANVSVMDWSGSMLKEADGNYTCMPTPPQFTKGRAPMCFDDTWIAWGDAWQNRKPFSTELIGLSYMLAGDEGASNIDPFATAATDDNDWIVEGPHMMLIAPDAAMLAGLSRDPQAGGPYVMWDGTPYAHVMIPVAERD